MAFRNGSISCARYRVIGDVPGDVTDELLEALAGHVLTPPSVGAPPEVQAGWCAGRHVFDTTFDAETVAFGSRLLFGMRLDTARVPAEVRRAYRALAEAAQSAHGAGTGLSRSERQVAKEDAEDRCRRELAEGRHRSSSMVPVLWDLRRKLLFAPAFSDVKVTVLSDLFQSAFDATLQPLSAGAMAYDRLSGRGQTRAYEDASPTPFTAPPPAADAGERSDLRTPGVPWAHAGPEPKDFLGNEFVLWLWWCMDVRGGLIETAEGPVAAVVDHALDMECAWSATGKQSLRATGPTRLPEAAAALRSGKWPRRAGLIVAAGEDQWTLGLQADRFLLTGVKVPRPDDATGRSAREMVEHRLDSLDHLDRAMVALFDVFLEERFGGAWPTRGAAMSEWIKQQGRRRPTETPVPEIVVTEGAAAVVG